MGKQSTSKQADAAVFSRLQEENEVEIEQDPKAAEPTEEALVKAHTRKLKRTIDDLTEGLPLAKQEKIWAREGLALFCGTMANWVIKTARTWLKPLCRTLKKHLLKSSVIHADETVVQVLKEDGKPATFLKGFTGCLVTDGYAGYNQVEGVVRCGCWAHMRRK